MIERAAIPDDCIVKEGEDWMLISPVPPAILRAAAEYAVSTRATLNHIVGLPEVRRTVLGHRLRGDRICVAVVKGEVAGCLSYRMDGQGSVWPEAKQFRQHFGAASGTVRYALTQASLMRGRPDDLYIEGFRVDEKARGRGIGGALLDWLGAEVVRRGKAAWRTEASAGADAAIHVYQKAGARIVKTIKLGPVGKLFDRPAFVVLRWEPPRTQSSAAAAVEQP